uniref:(California timema) hypothetical protein n=1 Tax=Timema californicum TaxID=61474 RepID=A0A7R9J8K2_TIMCA|nr:unnamed protein product [Timema californicum]
MRFMKTEEEPEDPSKKLKLSLTFGSDKYKSGRGLDCRILNAVRDVHSGNVDLYASMNMVKTTLTNKKGLVHSQNLMDGKHISGTQLLGSFRLGTSGSVRMIVYIAPASAGNMTVGSSLTWVGVSLLPKEAPMPLGYLTLSIVFGAASITSGTNLEFLNYFETEDEMKRAYKLEKIKHCMPDFR